MLAFKQCLGLGGTSKAAEKVGGELEMELMVICRVLEACMRSY